MPSTGWKPIPPPPRVPPRVTPDWTIGYCTNIHAGADVATICDNLTTHTAAVARQTARRRGDDRLGVGLWIPAAAAASLGGPCRQQLFAAIDAAGVVAYTLNGFPHDDFHAPRVKHDVYRPAWWDPARADYTIRLAGVLTDLLAGDRRVGTISTLPIGWPSPDADVPAAAVQLRRVAESMKKLEAATGRRIIVAIEPEPGCLIDRHEQILAFFDEHLADPTSRRHLGVCHDVCHSAVMGEDQSAVIAAYAAAGITIAKSQISSAIDVDWRSVAAADRPAVLDQMRRFAEDRYLHQVMATEIGGAAVLHDDLPEVLERAAADAVWLKSQTRWRVHFHVPIFADRFDRLGTTRGDIDAALAALHAAGDRFTGHVEVETYAYNVMPAAAKVGSVTDCLVAELRYLDDRIDAMVHPR